MPDFEVTNPVKMSGRTKNLLEGQYVIGIFLLVHFECCLMKFHHVSMNLWQILPDYEATSFKF